MISLISGSIQDVQDNSIVVVQSGIGFHCFTTQAGQYQRDQSVTLHTYMHWNQEQGPSLFGFQSQLEKETFIMIIGCSGIGPKIALSILAQVSPSTFLQAIIENDIKTLNGFNGIGTKKAELLCLSLGSKAKTIIDKHPSLHQGSLGIWKDIEETLSSLNYSPHEVKQVSSLLKKEDGAKLTFDHLLRKALTLLAQK